MATSTIRLTRRFTTRAAGAGMVTLSVLIVLAGDIARAQESGIQTTAKSAAQVTLTSDRSPATKPHQDRAVRSALRPSPAGGFVSSGRFTGKVQRYAARLMARYDLNGDRLLDQSEWTLMRGDPGGTMDLDGDGVITTDEIVQRVAMYGRRSLRVVPNVPVRIAEPNDEATEPGTRRTSRVPADGEPSEQATASASGTAALRMIPRFFVPQSGLPQGVAGWFLDNDADGDGQVTMAEFSASWTEVEKKRFRIYDLNGDGVITAAECAQAEADRLAKEAAEAEKTDTAAEPSEGDEAKTAS